MNSRLNPLTNVSHDISRNVGRNVGTHVSTDRSPRPQAAATPSGAPMTLPHLRMLLATLVVAIAGTLSQTAFANPQEGHKGAAGYRGHGGSAEMGMMGGGRHVGRMLDTVNASAEQRAQVKQILEAARSDMGAQREAGRQLREQSRALFAQPTVDARAAEALRLQMLAQHDQSSKRMMQVMLDVSRVLTPEQRKTLSDRMAQRRSMMERHRSERQSMERAPR